MRRLSGEMLPDYTRETVFAPLGMHDTMFQPPASLRSRIAPTEMLDKDHLLLRGVVHDPTARYMGGIAGHAGLFSTADDLARFCQMMLDQRRVARRQALQPARPSKNSPRPRARPTSRSCAAWDGTSIRLFRATAAICFRSALRAHRIYRDFAVARSRFEYLRDSVDERRAPASAAGHHLAARQGGDHRGGRGGHRHCRA